MIYLTNENLPQIMSSTTPVVVDFYADWCGPCKMLSPLFEQLEKKHEGQIVFVKCDADQNTDILQAFHISALPTLMLIKNGQVVEKMTGFKPKETEDFILKLLK